MHKFTFTRFLRTTAECFARHSYGLGVRRGSDDQDDRDTVVSDKLRSTPIPPLMLHGTLRLTAAVGGRYDPSCSSVTDDDDDYDKNVILPLLARLVWKQLQIGTDMLLIITSTRQGFFSFINIDDTEQSWTFKRGFLANFSQLLTAANISRVKWLEIDQDNRSWNFQHQT